EDEQDQRVERDLRQRVERDEYGLGHLAGQAMQAEQQPDGDAAQDRDRQGVGEGGEGFPEVRPERVAAEQGERAPERGAGRGDGDVTGEPVQALPDRQQQQHDGEAVEELPHHRPRRAMMRRSQTWKNALTSVTSTMMKSIRAYIVRLSKLLKA